MLDRLSKRALAPENRRQRAWRAGRQPPHPWGLSVPPGPVCRPARSRRPLFCSAEKADWGQGLRTPRSSSHFGVCSPCPHLRWLWSLCREVPLEGCSLSPPPPRAAPFGPTAPGMKRPQLRASCAPRGQPTPPQTPCTPPCPPDPPLALPSELRPLGPRPPVTVHPTPQPAWPQQPRSVDAIPRSSAPGGWRGCCPSVLSSRLVPLAHITVRGGCFSWEWLP